MNEIERALCIGGTFHIHAHEAGRVDGSSFDHESAHQFARQCFVDVQAHVRELQANVGVEMVLHNPIENLVVECCAVASLIGIGNVLTQVVDTHGHPRTIDGLGGAHGVSNLCASNKAV